VRINGRHIIVSASDAAEQREVLEVFEITNDTSVTRVSGGRDSATFRVVLPEGATGFSGQQGDVSPEAIALVNGRAEVYAPLAPGIKQISFSYKLPRSAFPLAVPAVDTTELLEVLLEDATGVAEGARLVRQGPVTSSGRTFVRWLAENVPAIAVVRVSFPSASRRPVIPTFVVVAAGLAAAMLFAMRTIARRRVPAERAPVDADADPDRLASRIAALDAAFDRKRLGARALGREVDADDRAAYEAERTRLKGALTDALARRDERG
jgi:hypothetical protein